jgi:pilus assembly protein Flp/PilA
MAMKRLVRFLRKQKGATMVEYGIMVALIAVVAIGAVALVGGEVEEAFNCVADSINDGANSC